MAEDNFNEKLNEQINIMRASAAGAPIAVKPNGSKRWSSVKEPSFNWGTSDYKVELNYEDLFNSTVSSLDYTDLQKKLFYLERGKKLQNLIEYSATVLRDSKTKIASDIQSNLESNYQNIYNDIAVSNITNTSIYTTVYNNLKAKYLREAEENIDNDSSLLSTYGTLENYYTQVFEPTVQQEIADMVSELNTTIKNSINFDISPIVNISNNAIDSAIIQQLGKNESDLYQNDAATTTELEQRVSNVMSSAMEKYNNSLDDTYAVAHDDNIRVTIKKQLDEPEPAINIGYSLFNYSLNGDNNPQMDWDFNGEGKVVTVTGITPDEARTLVNNSYSQFMDKITETKNELMSLNASTAELFDNKVNILNASYDSLATSVASSLSTMQTRFTNALNEFRTNASFTNLSVTNPIQGSLVGNTVKTNSLTVNNTATFEKGISVKDNVAARAFFRPITVPFGASGNCLYVFCLGNIPEVTDTAQPATTGNYNWDMAGTLTLIRSSGHNAGSVHFFAGHGYANTWITYINLDYVEANGVFFTPVTFKYKNITRLGIKVEVRNENYEAGLSLNYFRNVGTLDSYSQTLIPYYSKYQGVESIIDSEIYQSVATAPSSWTKPTKFIKLNSSTVTADNISTATSMSSPKFIVPSGSSNIVTLNTDGISTSKSISASVAISSKDISASNIVSSKDISATNNISATNDITAGAFKTANNVISISNSGVSFGIASNAVNLTVSNGTITTKDIKLSNDNNTIESLLSTITDLKNRLSTLESQIEINNNANDIISEIINRMSYVINYFSYVYMQNRNFRFYDYLSSEGQSSNSGLSKNIQQIDGYLDYMNTWYSNSRYYGDEYYSYKFNANWTVSLSNENDELLRNINIIMNFLNSKSSYYSNTYISNIPYVSMTANSLANRIESALTSLTSQFPSGNYKRYDVWKNSGNYSNYSGNEKKLRIIDGYLSSSYARDIFSTSNYSNYKNLMGFNFTSAPLLKNLSIIDQYLFSYTSAYVNYIINNSV